MNRATLLTILCVNGVASILWTQITNMDGKLVTNKSQKLQTSKIKCASVCTINSECVSFFYDRILGICYFHEQIYNEDTPSMAANTVYYTSTSEGTSQAVSTAMTSATPTPETTTSRETSTPSFVCPLSYSMAGGMCFHVKNNLATWPDARASCIGEDGDLIILDPQQKIDAIAIHIPVTGLYQIGIHHIYSNGDFEFVDGRTQTDVTFNAWRPLEPNNNAGPDSCGRLRNFHWEDGDCNSARKFICEIK